MATANSTESLIDPVGERIFADRYSELTLTRLWLIQARNGNKTVVSFQGPTDYLLERGLIDRGMLPVGRKRKRYSDESDSNLIGVDYWWVTLKAKGRVDFLLHINDEIPADNPLSIFAPKHWPLVANDDDRKAMIAYNMRSRLTFMACAIRTGIDGFANTEHGMRLATDDLARIQAELNSILSRLIALETQPLRFHRVHNFRVVQGGRA